MENDIQKMKCPLCGAADPKHAFEKNGFFLYRCPHCKLLFVHPLPKNIEIYDQSYFKGADKGFGYVEYDTDKKAMQPVFEKYLDILSKLDLKKGKFLDVGCATGFFMNLVRQRGFEVCGVELSDYAAELGRKKCLDIKTGSLSSAKFADNYFDCVSLCDVLEHVPEPVEFLLEVRRILKPGGFCLVNTPDAESLYAKMLGRSWHLLVPPEHLHYFSPANLADFLIEHGFQIRVDRKIGKRFSWAYIFKTLHAWQQLSLWHVLENFFSKKFFKPFFLPINLYDNFFMVAEKKD